MVADAELYAEADKARKSLIEEANRAESVCHDTEKGTRFSLTIAILHRLTYPNFVAMKDFKDQLDTAEQEKVTKLVTELRELAVKGQAGDSSITAEQIKEAIGTTQQASLGLFQKVYEKRQAENSASSSSESESKPEEEKKN